MYFLRFFFCLNLVVYSTSRHGKSNRNKLWCASRSRFKDLMKAVVVEKKSHVSDAVICVSLG